MLIQQIRDSITKQSLLKNQDGWKNILMDVPPILWFGNMESDKPKIVTIGANPSNREFFSLKGKAYHRFNYSAINPYNPIELEHAYNNYFNNLPYRGWFGSEKGTKVEAFLHGLDASYYDNTDKKYQAIHIDFFPFATSKKFTDDEVLPIVKESLFDTQWTNRSVADLIAAIHPKLIFMFGSTNIDCFRKFVPEIASKYAYSDWITWSNGIVNTRYMVGKNNQNNFPPIVLLSAYLGNPRGFKTNDITALAKHILKNHI